MKNSQNRTKSNCFVEIDVTGVQECLLDSREPEEIKNGSTLSSKMSLCRWRARRLAEKKRREQGAATEARGIRYVRGAFENEWNVE